MLSTPCEACGPPGNRSLHALDLHARIDELEQAIDELASIPPDDAAKLPWASFHRLMKVTGLARPRGVPSRGTP